VTNRWFRTETLVNLRRQLRRPLVLTLAAVIVIAAVVVAVRGGRRSTASTDVPTQAVERRSITLTIEATGTVEPIDLVEVKSKASGQIVRMPVQVGDQVRAGDLLAQIDPRDVQNQYSQALASLRAAQASAQVAIAQKKRADELFRQQIITAPEHEAAVLQHANAQAQLVQARTEVDLARQRREDATVRAPSSGTVIQQLVSTGQVIASATSSASGGTSLLKMADLSRIRLRALVSETDIGNVRPGQTATVTVDAYPQRTFVGQVEKVEPQSVVQQSVTMFPVLISISNQGGVLLPGMNGEVAMLVDRRDNVPAVPVDGVRTVRELPVAAEALGLNPDSVRAQVNRQVEQRAAEREQRLGRGEGSNESSMVGAAFTGDSARGEGRRARWRADTTAAAGRGGRRAWGGRSGGGGASARGGSGGAVGPSMRGATGGMGAAWSGGTGGRASRAQVVFVKTAHGFEPRVVRLGLSDFDYYEVLSGVEVGEQVALLGVAEAQAQRTETQSRIRQRMGSGMPGVPGGGGSGGARRGGS
jgi:HlyD family secretion protein